MPNLFNITEHEEVKGLLVDFVFSEIGKDIEITNKLLNKVAIKRIGCKSHKHDKYDTIEKYLIINQKLHH